MKARLIKLLDYFFVLRPTLFYPVWTVALAGFWLQERSQTTTIVEPISDGHFLLFLTALTLVLGASFLLNQTTDILSDKINNKLYLIANGHISLRAAHRETAVLVGLSLFTVAWLRIDLALWLLLAFLVTGWAYSAPPLLLKNRPLAGIFANLAGAGIIFAFGWCLQGALSMATLWHALPYLFGVLAVYFFTTIPDLVGDQAADKITAAVKWGPRNTLIAGLIAHVIAILSALLRDWILLSAAVLLLPFFLRSLQRKDNASVLQTGKYAVLILSLWICLRFPFYLLLLSLLFFFSKWYYRHRFQVSYPSLHT